MKSNMTRQGRNARLRRIELDRFFELVRSLELAPPREGWIADIRESLGMTGKDFARRLGIDPSSAKRLEQSEAKRSVKLASLDRAAEALGCRVAYVLIPDQPLEDTVRARAAALVDRLHAPVAHSMALEDQTSDQLSTKDRREILIDELIANLDPEIWKPDI
jgi:predicted DNA-binding mobile mystery protein A